MQGLEPVEEVERLARRVVGGEVAGEGETGAPVLRVGGDQPPAQAREPCRLVGLGIRRFESGERQVRALGRPFDQPFPGADGRSRVPFEEADVSEVQIRRRVGPVEIDRGLEVTCRLRVVHPLERLEADLVFQEPEDLLVPRVRRIGGGAGGELRAGFLGRRRLEIERKAGRHDVPEFADRCGHGMELSAKESCEAVRAELARVGERPAIPIYEMLGHLHEVVACVLIGLDGPIERQGAIRQVRMRVEIAAPEAAFERKGRNVRHAIFLCASLMTDFPSDGKLHAQLDHPVGRDTIETGGARRLVGKHDK